jgi:hypothetical protein
LSAVASKVFSAFSAISLFGWAAAAGDTEAMACPIAPAIDNLPTVVRTCLRLWPSFPLDIEYSCFGYGVDCGEIAAGVDLPIK